jgi:hypothetical protein
VMRKRTNAVFQTMARLLKKRRQDDDETRT